MPKSLRKRPQITEKIQVGCVWKLIGIFDNRHGRPNQKLLYNVKHKNKHVIARDRENTGSLDKNCQRITNALENKFVEVNIGERNATKVVKEDGKMHNSKQLLDALEILDSNAELSLKLLHDPNSLLGKQICNVEDLQEEKEKTKSLQVNNLSECGTSTILRKCQKPKHTMHKSFLERIKSSVDIEIPCTSDSIVVMKPSQKEHGKYKLWKHKDLEPNTRTEIAATTGSVCTNSHSYTVSYSNQRDLEAMKRLSERLRNVEKGASLSVKQGPKTLRRILSSPHSSPEHYLLPTFSPKRDRDASVSPKMKYSTCRNFQLASESNSWRLKNEEVLTCPDYMKPDDQQQIFDSEAKSLETICSNEELSFDAYLKIIKVNDTIRSGDINLSEMPSRPNNVFVTDAQQCTYITETQKKNLYSERSTQDLRLKNQALTSSSDVTSSNPMSIYKLEIEDSTKDREERLSPVSVLEPLFTNDDFTNPSNTVNQSRKPPMQPLHIDFEEDFLSVDPIDSKINISSCIRTVSGLSWNKLLKNVRSSGQLLNLSSFDEPNLFADFMNDVLLEVNRRNAECNPWVSFIRPDIQPFSVLSKNVVEEVMKEVHWYVVPSVMPRTLGHLVGKDMKNIESWSGTWLDTEDVVIQIVDDVLEESIMETIYVIEK